MHRNLFSNGHTTTEVYEAMLKHQIRDERIVLIADIGLIAGIWMATNASADDRFLWLVLIAVCGMTALRFFIDMSNRNLLLHRLDWEWAKQREDSDESLRMDRLRRGIRED